MADQPGKTPQTETFARNVTDFEGLGCALMKAAQADLGSGASPEEIDARASNLLLQSLLAVGVDPRTELVQRKRLTLLLRGDPLPEAEVQKACEYILSQMVVQPKGTLSECLSISGCIQKIESMKSAGLLPENAGVKRGGWARRLVHCGRTGSLRFEEWREAADVIFFTSLSDEVNLEVGEASSGRAVPTRDDLLVLGVAEVKCYSGASRKRLNAQIEKHLARLRGGLQWRDPRGRTVEREYAPSQLWYAVPHRDGLYIVCAADHPARVERKPDGRTTDIVWVDPKLRSLIRLAIGPRPSSRTMHRGPGVFDWELPFDEDQLEEIGSDMAYYTLGVMADQPGVDLSWDEWSDNLGRALERVYAGLSRRQLARRQRILSQLR